MVLYTGLSLKPLLSRLAASKLMDTGEISLGKARAPVRRILEVIFLSIFTNG